MQLPAGLWRNGTIRQARGRYYDATLIRFYEGTIRPVGGWQAHSASTVTGAARRIIGWVDNSGARWIGIGTHSNLYAMNRAGTLYDITPSGFTTGRADASSAGGYGSGAYGTGPYGTPRPATGSIQFPTVWSLDTWGEYLVGCNADDGELYEWQLDTGTPADVITDAPSNNRACLVTEEGFLVALGADGNPRLVQWCDQRDNTTWSPTVANQARSIPLQTQGRIMCGVRTRGAFLVLTDQDVHRGVYQGLPYVYGLERVGQDCGVISQAAAIAAGDLVAWMGEGGFWLYDGYVKPLQSEVGDYVFTDLNQTQRGKAFAIHNPQFGEVTWFYPSGGSNEVDRYVTWNYRESHWAIGSLIRTCGVARGAFEVPLMVDDGGTVYEHEVGVGWGSLTPYVETGPLEWTEETGEVGRRIVSVLGINPDERTEGEVEATFLARMYPNGDETTYGPYDLTEKNVGGIVPTRFTTRDVRMRLSATGQNDFRVGQFSLELEPGGER